MSPLTLTVLKPPRRRKREPKVTSRQRAAMMSRDAGCTFSDIAKGFSITRQGARALYSRGLRTASEAATWQASSQV